MSAGLRPYSELKDSDIERVGQVPAHWEVRKLRHILRAVNKRNRPELPLLSVVREKGIVLRNIADPEENHNFVPDDLSNYKVVQRGQFAVNKMKSWQGSFGVSKYDGIVSPAYYIFDVDDVDGAYFHASIRSRAYIPYFSQASDGVRIGQWDLSQARMREIPFLLPLRSEQTAIVRFLDHAERRIRRYIRAKEKLIALLEEQKQAIIHQAVTGQIDISTGTSYLARKDSGIDWLPRVPVHWQILRLKDVAQIQAGLTLGKDYRNSPTVSRPYLRVANVQQGHLDLTSIKWIDIPSDEAGRTTLRKGDVLMTEGGDIDKLGRGCLWQGELTGCLHQNHIFAVRCRRRMLVPEFLVALMTSQHGRTYFQLTAKKTTNLASPNSSTLRAFPVPLPPVHDQLTILETISKEIESLDIASRGAGQEIELIREFHTRLISDVVTGKLARIRHRFGISSSLCWYWTRIGSRYPLWVVRRYARRVFGPFQERLLPVHRATLTWIANGGRAPTSASRRCSVNAVQRWSSYPGSRHSGSRCRFASTSAKTLA